MILKVPFGLDLIPSFLDRELSRFSSIEFENKNDNSFAYMIFRYEGRYRLASIFEGIPTCHSDRDSLFEIFRENPELYRYCRIIGKE